MAWQHRDPDPLPAPGGSRTGPLRCPGEVGRAYHTPYPEGEDALRFTTAPGTGQHMETLTFHFPTVDGPEATLAFQWGTTIVEIPIAIEEGEAFSLSPGTLSRYCITPECA
ncbi:MAG: DUF2911 domain-containing protein [Gemmatimonadota bacterium]|nr:DUF2911 domain-containing protein [Gemmatimonadota bacterium]MDH3366334.1 DUF2911 domain-containing protein [Gemmatimonadota bacterium]MDH3477794.1 DUF2911 domain-containing protein [Gemmatimonadota bacterium]MDH3569511.1 DUF2911 domain-containing protein [Gemmatimonadota bacterium]MDH5549313.1 DUF2911 domain-containing protein [Gemmatimonadota bacterium]